MNSPLQAGRKRRTLPMTRRATGLVPLVLLAVAGPAGWRLTRDDGATLQPPAAAIHQPVGEGTSTRPPARPHAGTPPPGIALFGGHRPLKLHFKTPPRAGLVFDLATGQVLWAHRPLQKLPIASLTKLMTAVIVVERTKPSDRARVTREALHYTGSGVGLLPKG